MEGQTQSVETSVSALPRSILVPLPPGPAASPGPAPGYPRTDQEEQGPGQQHPLAKGLLARWLLATRVPHMQHSHAARPPQTRPEVQTQEQGPQSALRGPQESM